MKICNACETVFEYDLDLKDCPIKGCFGEIVEIDENLFETYKILNRKGYFTANCCSGHSSLGERDCPQTYIQFYNKIKFIRLPKEFVAETHRINNGYVTNISKSYDKKLSSVEMQKQIWNTSLDVLEWAEALDEYHE